MKIVEVPANLETVVIRYDDWNPPTIIVWEEPEKLERMGCVLRRKDRAYSWHQCPFHDHIVIWGIWD